MVEQIHSRETIKANLEMVTDLNMRNLIQKIGYCCLDLWITQYLCHIHVEEVLKRHNGVLAILSDIEGRDKGLLGLVELMVLGEELVPGRGIDQSLS